MPASTIRTNVASASNANLATPTDLSVPDASNPTFATVTATGQFISSTADNITAFAGGGQGSATALTALLNRVTTVASAADSVKLPASAAGYIVTVTNAHASNSMNVFPATGDAINAGAANAAFAVAAGKTCDFVCHTAGRWHALLSA